MKTIVREESHPEHLKRLEPEIKSKVSLIPFEVTGISFQSFINLDGDSEWALHIKLPETSDFRKLSKTEWEQIHQFKREVLVLFLENKLTPLIIRFVN